MIKKKTNVLLINPPLEDLTFDGNWVKTDVLTPPLGLMYLANPLIKSGYNVTFIDLNIERYKEHEFIDIIKDKDFVLFYCYTFSMKNISRMIKIVKKVNKNTFVMCGGPYCNFSQTYVTGSDMIVIGEAEERIVDILDRILSKKSLSNIPGLMYKKNGELIRNPGILHVENINQSIHSSWELTREKDYGYFLGYKVKHITGMVCSRGCPFPCTFCTNKGILKYRKRSVDNIIDELKDLQKKGFRYVVFYDENFLTDKTWVIKIMDRIIKEKIKLKIVLQCRVDSPDYELYRKLRQAGVVIIIFGIENANQDVLDFYQKGITVNMIHKAIEYANKAGLLTCGFFMLGSPLEDQQHFKVNKEFINNIPLDYINVNILRYYQGTKLWDDALKAGLIKENEIIVYANKKLSRHSYEEWLGLKEQLLKDFYIKPSRIIRLFYKLFSLGLFPLFISLLIQIMTHSFEKVANPFMPVDKEAKIKV